MQQDKLIKNVLLTSITTFYLIAFTNFAFAQENCFGDFCEKSELKPTQTDTRQINTTNFPDNPNNSTNVNASATRSGGKNNKRTTTNSSSNNTTSPNSVSRLGFDPANASFGGSQGAEGIGSGCGSQACLSRGTGQVGEGETPDDIRELLDQDRE